MFMYELLFFVVIPEVFNRVSRLVPAKVGNYK